MRMHSFNCAAHMHELGYCISLLHNKMQTRSYTHCLSSLIHTNELLFNQTMLNAAFEVQAPVVSIDRLCPPLISLSLFLYKYILSLGLSLVSLLHLNTLSPSSVFFVSHLSFQWVSFSNWSLGHTVHGSHLNKCGVRQ